MSAGCSAKVAGRWSLSPDPGYTEEFQHFYYALYIARWPTINQGIVPYVVQRTKHSVKEPERICFTDGIQVSILFTGTTLYFALFTVVLNKRASLCMTLPM